MSRDLSSLSDVSEDEYRATAPRARRFREEIAAALDTARRMRRSEDQFRASRNIEFNDIREPGFSSSGEQHAANADLLFCGVRVGHTCLRVAIIALTDEHSQNPRQGWADQDELLKGVSSVLFQRAGLTRAGASSFWLALVGSPFRDVVLAQERRVLSSCLRRYRGGLGTPPKQWTQRFDSLECRLEKFP